MKVHNYYFFEKPWFTWVLVILLIILIGLLINTIL